MKTPAYLLRAAICLPVFVLGFATSTASAQVIVPVSQARNISADSFSTTLSTNPSVSAADFGVFNAQITLPNSSASQNSTIDTATITASGATHGTSNAPNSGSGFSNFSVTFNLASPCLFVLSGSMLTIFDQSFPPTQSINLASTNGTVFHQDGFGGTFPMNLPPTTFFTNGVLPSGQYTLSLHASGQGIHFATENYNFAFTVTPVPEPATSALLVLGTAALLGLRRRRPSSPR